MLAMIGSVITAASSWPCCFMTRSRAAASFHGRQDNIVEGRCRDAFRVGHAGRILRRAQLLRRMTMRVQKIRDRTSRGSALRI